MRAFGSSRARAVSIAALLSAFLAARGPLAAGERNVAGNCNGDLRLDLADGVFLLQFLFSGGARPECRARCDFEGDGALEVTDAIALVTFLMQGTAPPPPLVLPPETCGDGEDDDCDGEVDEGCLPEEVGYSVEIVWDEVTKDRSGRPETVAGYLVYFLSGHVPALVREVRGETRAVLRGLRHGVPYTVFVTAFDAAGNESAPSALLLVLR